jgi:putative hydrolase of the HAD superfamily
MDKNRSIEAILFDLDGTLLDRRNSLLVYLRQQLIRCADILGSVLQADYLGRMIELDNNGYCPKDVVFQKIEHDFELSKNSWETLFADFYEHFPDTCVPFPRMHQTLTSLAEKGYKLGLITNGSVASQAPKIDGLGIRRYFGSILISEAEGIRKPEPKIFARALSKLEVCPEKAVFIGDNPEADIVGAQSAKMKAIWIRDAFWPEAESADSIINVLADLPIALGILDNDDS